MQKPIRLLIAWSTPECLWGPFSRAVGFLAACLCLAGSRSQIESIKLVVGERQISMTPGFLKIGILAGMVEHYLQILRDYRPGGWRPRRSTFQKL